VTADIREESQGSLLRARQLLTDAVRKLADVSQMIEGLKDLVTNTADVALAAFCERLQPAVGEAIQAFASQIDPDALSGLRKNFTVAFTEYQEKQLARGIVPRRQLTLCSPMPLSTRWQAIVAK
jgi:hypothetical protein